MLMIVKFVSKHKQTGGDSAAALKSFGYDLSAEVMELTEAVFLGEIFS